MTVESNKILGGVGAILMFVGAIAVDFTFGILLLIGAILVLVALSGLGNYYQDKAIFTWSIYSFIVAIVGTAAAVATGAYIALDTNIAKNFFAELYPNWNGHWSTIRSYLGTSPSTSNLTHSAAATFLGAIFGVLAILWVFLIVSAFFARRSMKNLSAKSNVGLFGTASLLLLIGAFLTIVFIGFFVMWIAVLLLAIAFFQMKAQQEQPMATQSPPPPSTPIPV